MNVAEKILYFAHMGGLLTILTGWLMAAKDGVETTVLAWGARIQLALGLILVAVTIGGDDPRSHLWMGLKLLVALGVVACAEMARVRAGKGTPQPALVHAAGALTLVNVAVAFAVH